MILYTPKKALEILNDENSKTSAMIKNIIIERKKSFLKNFDEEIKGSELEVIIEDIKEYFGIIFNEKEIKEIIDLYPQEKSKITQFSYYDTEARESINFIISHFFIDSEYPIYGDNLTEEQLEKFLNLIKGMAKNFGYKVI